LHAPATPGKIGPGKIGFDRDRGPTDSKGGTRMAGTANPVTTADTGNRWLDSILWGKQWDSGAAAGSPTVVTYYIAGQNGNEAVNLDSSSVTALGSIFAEEVDSMISAMNALSTVCNLTFQSAATQADADIIWASVNNRDADGALGWANPPGTEFNSSLGEAQSLIISNHSSYRPTSPNANLLVPGGYDYITFIHELGHAVGLAHPHDRGGGSLIAPGVSSATGDYGTAGLNQGVFSMMSYNDGWKTGPTGAPGKPIFGYEIGPMAFDIAALQILYGANMSYHAGDDDYTLPTANVAGTGYLCLWDAGGEDEIIGGDRGNLIDLRAATLETARGGGGWVSYGKGIHGGFTIANGVVIENATGGAGVDLLRGNISDNVLTGAGGADRLSGLAGADTLIGGSGRDLMTGGLDADTFLYALLTDSGIGASRDQILDFARGVDKIDVSAIDAIDGGADDAFVLDTDGIFAAGEIRQVVSRSTVVLQFNTDADSAAEMTIAVNGAMLLGAGDFVL
jgi:serralysin